MNLVPETAAEDVFAYSSGAIMAHSIRAVTEYCWRYRVELHVVVIAEPGILVKTAGKTSLLFTRFSAGERFGSSGDMDRVRARIFIHKDASKSLAALCVAHHIYHLMLELDAFLSSGRVTWSGVPWTKTIEDECDRFAFRLCKLHASGGGGGRTHTRFPEGIFDKPVNINDLELISHWPAGLRFDPKHPFYTELGVRTLFQRTPASGVATAVLAETPRAWTDVLEEEFRGLASKEAQGSISAEESARLENLDRWRDDLSDAPTAEQAELQTRRDLILEKMARVLSEYVSLQERAGS